MGDCLYISGTCDHRECSDWWAGTPQQEQPQPTAEDYCAGDGHAYYGDDGPPPHGVGRCYCGAKSYPLGGGSTKGERG